MTIHQAPPLERYRAELIGYAYRVLGSRFEAEDAVQETLLRAWRAHERFEGRATLRTWLYRIARNVCLDMLAHPQRRTVPMDPGTSTDADPLIEPMSHDAHPWSSGGDPAETVLTRESVRQAFMVAIQHLPPRQRAALLMCEVLRWRASEAAELLGTSVASVNSALQRARLTLAARQEGGAPEPMRPEHRALLGRYTDAFERDDIPSLTALVRDDSRQPRRERGDRQRTNIGKRPRLAIAP